MPPKSSPRRLTAGALQNSSVSSSMNHEHLREELKKHVFYDDPSVFKRLGVYDNDASAIARCHADYMADPLMQKHAETLAEISEDAKKRIQKREKEMYGPLGDIFKFIANWGDDGAGATREFELSTGISMLPPEVATEAYTPSRNDYKPDFRLLPKRGRDLSLSLASVAFAEVKASPVENGATDTAVVVKGTILQCADYARYHMAFHPFWTFTVILLIAGTTFRVMIVDHEDVLLSPVHDIIGIHKPGTAAKNFELFVRVVRALTRRLTDIQLGQDPSVVPISFDELAGYKDRLDTSDPLRHEIKLELGEYYPSYRILPFGNDPVEWGTLGIPIWSSMSLRGRGTQVWRVCKLVPVQGGMTFSGEVHVMKSAWRDTRKVAEMDVYEQIGSPALASSGIAHSLYGDDVFYFRKLGDGKEWVPLSINNIRSSGGSDVSLAKSSPKTLHRIFLETLGEPLWGYQNELELLEAFSAIIKAHKFLCERGIVHRDISPGNALLRRGGPVKGFITDFDIAHVDDKLMTSLKNRVGKDPVRKGTDRSSGKPIMTPSSVHTVIDYTSPRPHGETITGTIQFMALPLLAALMSGASVEHTASHDLESIAYLLGYTVLRRLVMTPDCPISLDQVLAKCFGQPTVGGILDNRKTRAHWNGSTPTRLIMIEDCL
ncbi:hypothetical protein C8Q72DRAFT_784068 [Fomitopsis betulina]|nr:hypothetical protein C8Q72DRAFT_784068 [Fomitopsis betulina]